MLIQTKFEIGDTVWAVKKINAVWQMFGPLVISSITVHIELQLRESYAFQETTDELELSAIFTSKKDAKHACEVRNVRAANDVNVRRVHQDAGVS